MPALRPRSPARTRTASRRGGPLLGLVVGLVACRPDAATTQPPPGPAPIVEAPPAPRGDPELIAIADAIDPGEVKPLLTVLPAWLAGALRRQVADDVSPAELVELARADLDAYERERQGGDQLAAMISLGRAAYLGERLLLAGRDDPEILAILERAYTILQNPFFTAPNGFFRQSFAMVVQVLAQKGLVAEQAQVGELVAFLEDAFVRAGPLRQRSAALLLRHHPAHPAIADVLLHQADSASDREAHAEAVALDRLALARRAEPTSLHWCHLANHCAYALDLACADEALARARAWAPPADDPKAQAAHDERLRSAAGNRALADEALRLADDPAIEAALRRGHLLILLGRYGDAERLYTALRDQHPRDARPHAGLAKLAFQRNFDFYGAIPLLEAGRALDHHDRDFYEVSLGLASARVLGEILPRAAQGDDALAALPAFFAGFRADVRGWARFEPGRGAVLLALTASLEKILPPALAGDPRAAIPALRRTLADLDRVRVAHPEVADAWNAALAATLFSDDPRRAWAIAASPLPAALDGDDALHLARHRTLRSLVLLWEEDRALADLEAALALLPPRLREHPEAIETRALADVLRSGSGDAAAARRAAEGFILLAEQVQGVERARALANATVVLTMLGDTQAAVEAYTAGFALTDDKTRPFMVLLRHILELDPASVGEFDALSEEASSSSIRLLARAWRAELARRQKDPAAEALTRAYHAALQRERTSELRGRLPTGRLGFALTGVFQVNLSYSVREGLTARFAATNVPWLMPPAPLTLAGERGGEQAAKARRK